MSVLANHQLRPAASSRAQTRRNARNAPRVATVPRASSKQSPSDDTSKITHRQNAVGALIAGVAAASVALTAVPDVALAKAKPVTETPGASAATELNAAALYDKVSAANQAKVATPSNDAEPNQAVVASSGPKKTTRAFDSFADFKAELAEDMVTTPSTAKEPKKPTQKSFDSSSASTQKETFAAKLDSSAAKRAEDDAKYAALRAEYEAKMDRIRAERRLQEKARVASQNAEVRAKKDAAKAKSDEVAAKNAAREAAFRAEQDAKAAAKAAAQAKEQKKNAASDKKAAAASEKKAREAAKKKAEASAAAKKAKVRLF